MQFRDKTLDLTRPRVMGILNVTPDSFSDGGRFTTVDAAFAQASKMVDEGADILDVGGESTRPGAEPVSEQQELDRVIPVIEAICKSLNVIVSIDTSKPGVMREAVAAGAGMINDVYALRAEQAVDTAAQLQVPVCLMHMQGEPRTMQSAPQYNDLLGEIKAFLQARVDACTAAGITRDQLIVDPGFGFGKTVQHNMRLTGNLAEFAELGLPVLYGASRKSSLGSILDKDADQRLFGSLALAALAIERGASIIRVHDVGPTVDVIKTITAVQNALQEQ